MAGAPSPQPALGHHVCVCLEEQGLAGPVSIPHRPHVRASRRDLLRADLEAFVFEVVNEEPGNTGLVAVRFLGTVDARDADELLHEACQLLAVYSSQHRFEQVPEFVFSEPLRARLRQRLSDAALRRIALQSPLDRVEEVESDTSVEDTVIEGDLEVHHAADGYGVVHDDGPLDDGLGLQYRRLRVVYDGRGGDASRAPGLFTVNVPPDMSSVPSCLARARFTMSSILRARPTMLSSSASRMTGTTRAPSSRSTATPTLICLRSKILSPSHTELRTGCSLSLHRGLDDERKVGQLDSLALGERFLLLLAQRGETRHVHLDQRPGVRYLRLA